MKILIFEADHHGHRLMAVRVLIEALLELRHEHERHALSVGDPDTTVEHRQLHTLDIVLATTEAAAHSEEFAEQLSELLPEIQLAILPAVNSQQSPWRVALRKTRVLRHVLQTQQPDHLYIPYVDGMLQIISLLLAGKQSDAIRQLLAAGSDCSQIICLDRYLKEEEHNQAICALVLSVSPYAGFTGSASMVLRAAAAERMSLTADNHWMKLVLSSFELGRTCNLKISSELTAALMKSLPESRTFQLSETARRFVAYGQIDNVNAHWTDLLGSKLQLGSHPALIAWPSDTPLDHHIIRKKPAKKDG